MAGVYTDSPGSWGFSCGDSSCPLCKKYEEDYKLEKAKTDLAKVSREMQALRDSYSKAANLVKEINTKRAAEEARVAKEKAEKERARQAEALKAKTAELKAKRERKARTDRDTSGYLLRLVDELVDNLPKSADGIALTLAQKNQRGSRYAGSSNPLAVWLTREANEKGKTWYGSEAPNVTVFVERSSVLIETPRFQITFDVQDHVSEFMTKLGKFNYPSITDWS